LTILDGATTRATATTTFVTQSTTAIVTTMMPVHTLVAARVLNVDKSEPDPRQRDDERWPERGRDSRDLDPRDVFMRNLDLPRGREREIVHDPREREYTLRGRNSPDGSRDASAHQVLAAGAASPMGRRNLPPLTTVPVVMGEEPWRERPRLAAMNAFPRVFWSFTPRFPVSM